MNQNNRAVYIIWVLLALFTGVSILVIYGEEGFSMWRGFRSSTILAIFTYFWANTTNMNNDEFKKYMLYPIVVMPINLFLVYPGPKSLGVFGDDKVVLISIIIILLHGVGYKMFQNYMKV